MRIYIDSRFRTSGTDSDFTVSLARPLELPVNSVGIVEQVLLSNTFESVIAVVNAMRATLTLRSQPLTVNLAMDGVMARGCAIILASRHPVGQDGAGGCPDRP